MKDQRDPGAPLELDRTFPVVLLMSTLINHPDAARRAALVASCRRHVAAGGVVLIERLDPAAGLDTTPTERRHAGVLIRVFDISRDGQLLDQTIDYDAGDRGKWRVRREGARVLSDDEMRADLEAAGLRLDRWLDPARRWLMASPRP